MSGNFAPFTPQTGQLPTSQANLIICPPGTNYYLKQFILFNHNAASQSIQLFIVPSGGTARNLPQLTLAQNESAQVLDEAESITLTPGDAIQGMTTTAAAVDYTFTGIQET